MSETNLIAVLRKVNRDRVGRFAQRMYSQKDDQQWFISVTDDLYREAVRAITGVQDDEVCGLHSFFHK